MTVLPSTTSPGPVVAHSAGSGSDRVCASCGNYVRLVDVDQSVKAWTHARAPRWPHQIACVMGKSQWDRWAR